MDVAEPSALDRRTLLAAAAAGVAGAVVADDADAAELRTVVGRYSDPGLRLFKNRDNKRPIDGFNNALVDAAGKLALKRGQGKIVKVSFSAHAVYARDPGAYDEYIVTLTL